jgi:predicted regulator of Ras-like GTPase activity (Roadblock/LC7/MglB family)
MYRLALRKQWFPFVGCLLLCLVLVISVPSYSPDKVIKLPLLLVLFGEFIIAFGVTGLVYQQAPIAEKVKAAATLLAVSTGIGTIGNLTSQVNQLLPGSDVLISWIQLVIMNLGGFFATYALYEVSHGPAFDAMEGMADGVRSVKPREKMPAASPAAAVATKTSEKHPTVPQAGSTVATSSGSGFTAASLPHPTPMPGMPSPSQPALAFGANVFGEKSPPAIDKAAQASSATAETSTKKQKESKESKESRESPKITNERIQVQSKRNTTTFTKLQALSATGRQLVPETFGTATEGLKSILDRLEDQAEGGHAEQAPAASQAKSQAQSVTSSSAQTTAPAAKAAPTPAQTQTKAPATPAPPPAPPQSTPLATPAPTPTTAQSRTPAPQAKADAKKSNIASRLVGVVSRTKLPAAEKFLESSKPQSDLVPKKQEVASTSGTTEQAAAAAKEASDLVATRTVEDLEPIKVPSEPANQTTAAPVSPKPLETAALAPSTDKVFEATVDKEMDEVFAKLAPSEAQREFKPRDDKPAPDKPSADKPFVDAPSTSAAAKSMMQLGDNEMDEVFAKLVSPEAQKDVSARAKGTSAVPPVSEPAAPEGEQSSQMFSVGDADLDEAFSKLVSPEVQREFHPPPKPPEKPEPVKPPSEFKEGAAEEFLADAKAEPQQKPVPEREGEPIFQVVDEELDEVFSKLVSTEAQKEVTAKYSKAEENVEFEPAPPPTQPATPAFSQTEPQVQEIESEPAMSFHVSYQEEGTPFPSPETAEVSDEGLFGDEVAAELDQIFSSLVPPEAQREVHSADLGQEAERPSSPGPWQKIEASKPEPITAPPPTAPIPPAQAGMLGAGVNDEIDDIFSHIAPPEAQRNVSDRHISEPVEQATPSSSEISFAPPSEPDTSLVAPVPSAASAASEVAKDVEGESAPVQALEQEETVTEEEEEEEERPIVNPVTKNIEVKEFGRLSAKSAQENPQPNIPIGTMKTVGKLLIDVQAIENIIKSGESGQSSPGLATARIISATRGEGIKALLGRIDSYSGVTGCLIVGHDGLVIASTVGSDFDKDALGALSSALLNTSNLATLKLDIGKLRQMVMLTELTGAQGAKLVTTILTDVEVGVLAVFLDTQQLDRLDGVLDTIHTTIHG